jgi:hypothetical protein
MDRYRKRAIRRLTVAAVMAIVAIGAFAHTEMRTAKRSAPTLSGEAARSAVAERRLRKTWFDNVDEWPTDRFLEDLLLN